LIPKITTNQTDAGLEKDCLLQENIRLPGEAGFKPTILHPSWAGFMTLATEIPAAGKRDIWIAEENRPCMTQVNKCLTEEMKTDWKFGDFQQNKWNKWSSSRITVLKKMLGVGILIETWKSCMVWEENRVR
jgi:hypothetical protein